MKKVQILSVFLFLHLIAFAQDTDCSSLYVCRPNKLSGVLTSIEVYLNDVKVDDILNNSLTQVIIQQSGSYTVSVKWNLRQESYRKRTEQVINVTCSSNHYLLLDAGALTAEGLSKLVTEHQAAPEMAKIPDVRKKTLKYSGSSVAAVALNESVAIKEQPKPETKEKERRLAEEPVAVQEKTASENTANKLQQQEKIIETGTNYALLIAVEDYRDDAITDLNQPVADAKHLKDVLVRRYTFDAKNVKMLTNPTMTEITQSLEYYYKNIKLNDNLLVFYAGHGYWDKKFEQGYWLAADAQKSNRGTWLSNGTLRDYLRAIPSKHTLLITDACFSGGIFKTRDAFANSVAIKQLYKLPSRKAMTSGALSAVPDKSVFIEYLVKRLEQNEDKYLSSEQLFASFKIAVINNSANGQVPQFGEIKETGDEGGDYIFILK